MIIYMSHIRNVKICSSGTRKFFEAHGFDYSDFLKNGIPADKLLSTGDALAKLVVDTALADEG